MQTLPVNIRNLPIYQVPRQLFVCTTIFFIILTVFSLIAIIVWIYRSYRNIYNYQYIADREFMVYYKNKEERIRNQEPDEHENYIGSHATNSQQSQIGLTSESKYRDFNRNESRILQFLSLSVVAVIHVNAFAFNAFELIAFSIAIILFIIFNVLRIGQSREYLRLIFYLPLLVAYIPFFYESKALRTS